MINLEFHLYFLLVFARFRDNRSILNWNVQLTSRLCALCLGPRSCWPNWYLFCKTFKTSSQLLNSTALFLLLTTLQRSLLDHGSEVDTNDNMRWISRREILSLRLGLANRMEDRSIPQPFASDQQVYQNRVCCQWIRSSSSLG